MCDRSGFRVHSVVWVSTNDGCRRRPRERAVQRMHQHSDALNPKPLSILVRIRNDVCIEINMKNSSIPVCPISGMSHGYGYEVMSAPEEM